MKLVLCLLAVLVTTPATAALAPQEIARAVARPATDTRLPTTLRFIDAAGGGMTIGAAAAGRPTVLLFVDYTCAHLCGPGLTLTAGALHDAGLRPNRDYRLVVVGLNPRDGPAQARAMADARLVGLDDVRRAMVLLSGDAITIATAARLLGYGYAYDPATDQFAHDATVYIFGSDGRLRTTLPEVGAAPAAFKAALTGSTVEPAPVSVASQVATLCYGFAAAHGLHGRAIVAALRAAGVATLLLLAGGVLCLVRRQRKIA